MEVANWADSCLQGMFVRNIPDAVWLAIVICKDLSYEETSPNRRLGGDGCVEIIWYDMHARDWRDGRRRHLYCKELLYDGLYR